MTKPKRVNLTGAGKHDAALTECLAVLLESVRQRVAVDRAIVAVCEALGKPWDDEQRQGGGA